MHFYALKKPLGVFQRTDKAHQGFDRGALFFWDLGSLTK